MKIWFVDVGQPFRNESGIAIPAGRLKARWTSEDELEVLVTSGMWVHLDRQSWNDQHFNAGNVSLVREMDAAEWREQHAQSFFPGPQLRKAQKRGTHGGTD